MRHVVCMKSLTYTLTSGMGLGALVAGFECCKRERVVFRKVPYLDEESPGKPAAVNKPVEGLTEEGCRKDDVLSSSSLSRLTGL